MRAPPLRARAHGHARVTNVELFFDLVFVFAITQLSHNLLHHPTPVGALQTALLFLGVWWTWIFTSWVTNWLDPERTRVRVMLFLLMLAGLVLSISIPAAFEAKGMSFALAHVAMQVGRTAYVVSLVRSDAALRRNFQRTLAWMSLAGVFWVAGALVEGENRMMVWAAALLVEYAAPVAFFWVPGLGRSTLRDWQVEGGHLAERCALFIIVALGESILVTGATFADMAWSAVNLAAFAVAFGGSVAMWWVYFDSGAERGSRAIAGDALPGRMARLGYTYLHLPIVGGIILSAVGDEMLLAHPLGRTEGMAAAALLGGPALYLGGNALFKRLSLGHLPLSHLVGLALLAILSVVASALPPVAVAAGATLALVVVATWERASLGAPA